MCNTKFYFRKLTSLISLSLALAILQSCSNHDKQKITPTTFLLTETKVAFATHQLTAYTTNANTKYLVVFESGLGDDHEVWNQKNIAATIAPFADVLLYDRSGYGKSSVNSEPRNIEKLTTELETVIDHLANGRKVVLVAHSLGGMVIRDYAIKNPEKTAALLFVDSSHELYNNPTQEVEDLIYNTLLDAYGLHFGATMEARELVEDAQYMTTLSHLPNVPVIALTSMKIDAEHDAADRQLWFDSKEALRPGVNDFTHITTIRSGHYIMLDEPLLVLNSIQALLNKLP